MEIKKIENMYKQAKVYNAACGEVEVKGVTLYGVAEDNKLAFDSEGTKQLSFEEAVEILKGYVMVYDVEGNTTCLPVAFKENANAIEVTVVTGTEATPAFKLFKSKTK